MVELYIDGNKCIDPKARLIMLQFIATAMSLVLVNPPVSVSDQHGYTRIAACEYVVDTLHARGIHCITSKLTSLEFTGTKVLTILD